MQVYKGASEQSELTPCNNNRQFQGKSRGQIVISVKNINNNVIIEWCLIGVRKVDMGDYKVWCCM